MCFFTKKFFHSPTLSCIPTSFTCGLLSSIHSKISNLLLILTESFMFIFMTSNSYKSLFFGKGLYICVFTFISTTRNSVTVIFRSIYQNIVIFFIFPCLSKRFLKFIISHKNSSNFSIFNFYIFKGMFTLKY